MAGIGDTKRAVLLAKEMLESSDKFVADDSADKEAKADAAEHRDNYATVLSKNGEFSQANINYRTSIAAFDSLIAADAENAELYTRRFRTMINFGDSLASQKNYAEAERIYWSAYEKVKDVYAAKNPSFNLYAEGLTQNNPGDVYFLQSKFKQTQAAYHKALELWSRPEAQQTDLHRSPERIEWLREKISKTNQTS